MAKLKTSKRGSGDVEIKNAAKTLLANIRFLDVDTHLGGFGRRAVFDRAHEETAEEVVQRVAASDVAHS